MRAPSYASLDDALEILAPYGIVLKNGNSNHAPMVAEALCAMGRPEAVLPWIDRYRQLLAGVSSGGLTLPNDNIDVGEVTIAGKYIPASDERLAPGLEIDHDQEVHQHDRECETGTQPTNEERMVATWPRTTMLVPFGNCFCAAAVIFVISAATPPKSRP